MAAAVERRPTGLVEARDLVRDLFAPRPVLYWCDLLVSATIGWGASALLMSGVEGPWALLLGPVAVLALYRALLFIHEITHVDLETLPGFRAAWNLIIGIPLLVPSLTYEGVHTEHHRRTVYGTSRDPEYLPLARGSRFGIVWFLVESLFAPILFFARFVVVAPLGLAVPPLHRWLERRASSLVINMAYVRRDLDADQRRRLVGIELAMLALWVPVITLVLTGRLPARLIVVWFAISSSIALVNQVRTLAAHRFRNGGPELDVLGQLADSVNVTKGILTPVVAPVGLRFHALHHYLPDLPYHALGAAHRRLLAALPGDSVYRTVNAPGLGDVIATIWRDAGEKEKTCPSSTSIAS